MAGGFDDIERRVRQRAGRRLNHGGIPHEILVSREAQARASDAGKARTALPIQKCFSQRGIGIGIIGKEVAFIFRTGLCEGQRYAFWKR